MTNESPECQDIHAHGGNIRTIEGVSDATLEKAARIFRALGDPARLRILTVLSQGEACVSELATKDQLSTVSQRLRVLHSEDIVRRKRNGKHIIYSLADRHVVEMILNALDHAGETPPAE
ncbi:Winged helix-turn-helix transcriptional regulator [Sulfidibacter corallicola]|uniref:Winged helix-turn-helix transcriptional regulator n=1 Tax=Sulfidibacter corallicola TaxID=2818388 RepID=A0A8A4TP39_SULCO|nr:metalloregulator ArsR/SmtB family transcription factor [Sulfidibacter corallicola]QTD51197.1 winged helix-turn-helix transcriptional regulator [Sulfidibacter corallicola]